MEQHVITSDNILNFWFAETNKKCWFNSTASFDRAIRLNFEAIWEQAAKSKLDHWKQSPDSALALIILLDQFPLNMFRSTAKSFTTEKYAIEITYFSLSRKYDSQLSGKKLAFMYMPLMHSENIKDQNLSVTLFEKAELDDNLRYAKHHRKIIEKFGRFPHRNAILNRPSTPDELKYLASPDAFKG